MRRAAIPSRPSLAEHAIQPAMTIRSPVIHLLAIPDSEKGNRRRGEVYGRTDLRSSVILACLLRTQAAFLEPFRGASDPPLKRNARHPTQSLRRMSGI